MQNSKPPGHETDEEEDKNAAPRPEGKIFYERLGVDIPLNPEEEELYVNAGRIKVIENLEEMKNLKVLCLSAHFIEEIKGLDALTQLEHLELYQNSIQVLENVAHLTNLKILDLSFNSIRVIENIATLRNLEKLCLSSNKISEMSGIETLTNLKLLELGGNRIRRISNLETLTALEELWLGKNKITSMEVPPLPKLRQISLQSNRLVSWDTTLFDNLPELEELYVSHNRLDTIPREIAKLKKLRVLDIAGNQISDLSALVDNKELQELWVNDNQISSLDAIQVLRALPNLKTLYLERNPIQTALGPGYRTALLELAPESLQQIDAVLLKETFSVKVANDLPKPIRKV